MNGLDDIDFKPNPPLSASGEFLGGESAFGYNARIPFTYFGQFVSMTSPMSRLVNDPVLKSLNVGPLKRLELLDFYQLVQTQVGENIASLDQVEWVHSHYPLSLLAIRDGNEFSGDHRELVGVVAILFLSEAGEAALQDGIFTPTALKNEWLASDDDSYRAIYTWAIAANGKPGRYKLARLVHILSLDIFGGLNQYGFAATEAGKVFLTKLGFLDAQRTFPNVRSDTYFKPGQPVDGDGDLMLLPSTTPLRQ